MDLHLNYLLIIRSNSKQILDLFYHLLLVIPYYFIYFLVYYFINLGIILIIATWVYGKDIFYRENPKITNVELITKHPERYNLTQDKFNVG